MSEPKDTHARLQELVDETFGYRPTTPIEKLLDILEEEVPALVTTLDEEEAAHAETLQHMENLRAQVQMLREALEPIAALRNELELEHEMVRRAIEVLALTAEPKP